MNDDTFGVPSPVQPALNADDTKLVAYDNRVFQQATNSHGLYVPIPVSKPNRAQRRSELRRDIRGNRRKSPKRH